MTDRILGIDVGAASTSAGWWSAGRWTPVEGGETPPVDRSTLEGRAAAVAAALIAAGARPDDRVVAVHPATWDAAQLGRWRDLLAAGAGRAVEACPAPVAVATAELDLLVADGARAAVLDVGGSGTTACVVHRSGGRFEVVGRAGAAALGGARFDDVVVRHVLDASDPANAARLAAPVTDDDRADAARLADAVRAAREHLSDYPSTRVEVPGADPVIVTRTEMEGLLADLVETVCQGLTRAIADAAPDGVERVLLVGGASRLPSLRRRLTADHGTRLVVPAQPAGLAARGAARWAAAAATVPAAPPAGPVASPVATAPTAPPTIAGVPAPAAPPVAPPVDARVTGSWAPAAPPPDPRVTGSWAPAAPPPDPRVTGSWAPPPAAPGPTRGGARRWPLVAAAVVAVVVLGVAAVVVLGGDDDPPPPAVLATDLEPAIEVAELEGFSRGEINRTSYVSSIVDTADGRVIVTGSSDVEYGSSSAELWVYDGAWTQADPDDLGGGEVLGVAEVDGRFVATGAEYQGTDDVVAGGWSRSEPVVWTSDDAEVWERVEVDDFAFDDDELVRLGGVYVFDGRFFGLLVRLTPDADDPQDPDLLDVRIDVYASDDGEAWDLVDEGTFDGIEWLSVEQVGDRLVAAASYDPDTTDGPTVKVLVSDDGESWDEASGAGLDDGAVVRAIVPHGADTYVVGSRGDRGLIWVTDDVEGRWREVHETDGPGEITGLVVVPGGLVALGSTGDNARSVAATAWLSDDGDAWDEVVLTGARDGFYLSGAALAGVDEVVVALGPGNEQADGGGRQVAVVELEG